MIDKEIMHQVIAMLEWQLLTILALHDGPIVIQRIEGEAVKVLEVVLDVGCFPLHREVILVEDRVFAALKQMLLQMLVR